MKLCIFCWFVTKNLWKIANMYIFQNQEQQQDTCDLWKSSHIFSFQFDSIWYVPNDLLLLHFFSLVMIHPGTINHHLQNQQHIHHNFPLCAKYQKLNFDLTAPHRLSPFVLLPTINIICNEIAWYTNFLSTPWNNEWKTCE